MAPHFTLMFAACAALLQVALTSLVIARRVKTDIAFLDAGDKVLLRRMRAHGNFTETAPMALLLMGLLELKGLGSAWLLAFGSALLLGRLVHAFGLLHASTPWARIAGMLTTMAVIGVEALVGLWMFLA
jgi:uncharacterized membrane protein YecN with MAPEG domain